MNFCVYRITNLINNKIYIGKSNQPEKRWQTHLNIAKYKYSNTYSYVHKSINKYGKENFKFEILFYFENEEEAYDEETRLIKLYNSNDSKYGMNLNTGGRRSFKQNEEVRKKISEKRKGFVFTEESKEKMKNSHLGQIPISRKFNEKEVLQIRKEYQQFKFLKIKNASILLAEKYKVSISCMQKLLSGDNYASISYPTLVEDENKKTCSVCHQNKHKSEFYKSSKNSDGYYGRCKDCDKQAQEKSKKIISPDQKEINRKHSLEAGLATLIDPANREKGLIASRQKHSGNNKYLGVYSKRNKFFASINVNKKLYHIGTFETEEEAANARDAKAIELLGNKAVLNFSLKTDRCEK